jgi:hypothetical protein
MKVEVNTIGPLPPDLGVRMVYLDRDARGPVVRGKGRVGHARPAVRGPGPGDPVLVRVGAALLDGHRRRGRHPGVDAPEHDLDYFRVRLGQDVGFKDLLGCELLFHFLLRHRGLRGRGRSRLGKRVRFGTLGSTHG